MSIDRRFRNRIPVTTAGWIALPFGAGWADYGLGFMACSYRKVGDMVEVRGMAAGPAAPSTLATLPSGFRPGATEVFMLDANSAHARIDIGSTGVMTVQVKPGAGGYLSLSGIRFQSL